MIANSYFDGIIKTTVIVGQANSKTAEGLENRKPKERKGKRSYLCVGGHYSTPLTKHLSSTS